MIKKLLFGALLLLPLLAEAGGWTTPSTILAIIPEAQDDGSRLTIVFDTKNNPDNCQNNSGYTRVYASTPKGKNIVATAMLAYSSAKQVTPALIGCDDWGRPIVSGLWLWK